MTNPSIISRRAMLKQELSGLIGSVELELGALVYCLR